MLSRPKNTTKALTIGGEYRSKVCSSYCFLLRAHSTLSRVIHESKLDLKLVQRALCSLRQKLATCMLVGAGLLAGATAQAQTCGVGVPVGNRFALGDYTTVPPATGGPALPQSLAPITSVGGSVTLVGSASSTPTGLTNTGYQWGLGNQAFRPASNAQANVSASALGPWAIQTRNPGVTFLTDYAFTTVIDFTTGPYRPRGLSFLLADVDNNADLTTVRIFSGSSLVTYSYALNPGNTTIKVQSGVPTASGPFTNVTSGTSLSFLSTPSFNAAPNQANYYEGVITITPDASKLIDRIEVTRVIFVGTASGNASVGIGNFCWDTNEGVTVSGNVYNDPSGVSDSLVAGTGTNASSAALTAYLLNTATNIVSSSVVSASGTYSFALVPAGTYTVVLSNTPALIVGSPGPAPSLPAPWVNTGENIGAGAGSDGTVDGRSRPFAVTSTAVINVNFGIAQAVNLSVTKTNLVSSLQAGGTTSYTVTVANSGPANAAGAAIKDVPSAGLSCTVASCTPAGGATCPSPLASVLTPAGGSITNFPSASSLVFTVNCGVTATGV